MPGTRMSGGPEPERCIKGSSRRKHERKKKKEKRRRKKNEQRGQSQALFLWSFVFSLSS
jgi:hypothetical protein